MLKNALIMRNPLPDERIIADSILLPGNGINKAEEPSRTEIPIGFLIFSSMLPEFPLGSSAIGIVSCRRIAEEMQKKPEFDAWKAADRDYLRTQSLYRIMESAIQPITQDLIEIEKAENDISLFRAVSHSIAMGNAEEQVKEAADYITLTNEEEGVAEAIEKFVLRGGKGVC